MSVNKDEKRLSLGDKATFSKTISESDVYLYAGIVGDFNPVHINAVEAKKSIFKTRIAHGMLSAGLISTILGNILPGPGTIYLGQELTFKAPVFLGDTLTAECVIIEIREEKNIAKLSTIVYNQDSEKVLEGHAVVKMPISQ